MELNDLKNIWNQADQGDEQLLKVDQSFMRKLSLEKTQSSLNYLRGGTIVELLVNLIFVFPLASYAVGHLDQLKFAVPALLLAFMGVATIAWNIYSIFLLSTLSYMDSITLAQKRLTKFRHSNLFRQYTLLYILLPLSWGAILILFCKVILHLDLYQFPGFLLLNMAASVLLVPIMIWIAKKFPDKRMEETVNFLESIKKFESEG